MTESSKNGASQDVPQVDLTKVETHRTSNIATCLFSINGAAQDCAANDKLTWSLDLLPFLVPMWDKLEALQFFQSCECLNIAVTDKFLATVMLTPAPTEQMDPQQQQWLKIYKNLAPIR